MLAESTDPTDYNSGIETYVSHRLIQCQCRRYVIDTPLRQIGNLTEKNAQFSEMNRSLKNRLDSSNRLLEEAKTTNLDLHWQLDRDKKRSWEEVQQMDSEMTALKATRDYYKGRLDICQLENKRLKRNGVGTVDEPTAVTVTCPSGLPLQTTTSPNQVKSAVEESKDKNGTARPRNGREGEFVFDSRRSMTFKTPLHSLLVFRYSQPCAKAEW